MIVDGWKSLRISAAAAMMAAGILTHATRAFSCASCGSGGDDPLILYPWENWKVYTGFSKTDDFTPINSAGEVSREMGPQVRNTTTVSFGHTFSRRTFATVTAPYIVNRRDKYERSGWGDPMVTVRHTVLQQDMSEEWIPQIQIISAVKSGSATSVYDYEDPARLDVFGSGVPEGRLGFDVWNGMTDWKAGVAQTLTMPLSSRDTDFGTVRRGYTLRSTLTGGYGWGDRGKIIAGVNRESTTKSSVDGETQPNSDILSHSAFTSIDGKVAHAGTVRLTLARSAAFGANKNTSRNDTITLAYMRSL